MELYYKSRGGKCHLHKYILYWTCSVDIKLSYSLADDIIESSEGKNREEGRPREKGKRGLSINIKP